MADLLVFYVIPLFVNGVLYACIGKTLYYAPGSTKVRRTLAKVGSMMMMMMMMMATMMTMTMTMVMDPA